MPDQTVREWMNGGNLRFPPPTRTPQADKHAAVIAAAGSDLNDELTLDINAIDGAIQDTEPGSDIRVFLCEMRESMQRIAWIATELNNYASRHGARPASVPTYLAVTL
jgi:hypothetical protein